MPTDQDLLIRSIDGDQQAFSELAERYRDQVHACCRRRLPDWTQVEDAVQAVFLVLARTASTLAGSDEPLAPWLFTVAHHVARNQQR